MTRREKDGKLYLKGGGKVLDKRLFKARALLAELSMDDMAKALEINATTLYRKLNGRSDFTRSEIQTLRTLLKLDAKEVEDIFFTD